MDNIGRKMSASDIAIIRDWINKSRHICQDYNADRIITMFLNASKGSVQTAKQRIEKCNLLRHKLEFVFKVNWDPFSDEMIHFVNRVAIVYLPMIDGTALVIAAVGEGDPDPNFAVKFMMLWQYFYRTLLWEDSTVQKRALIVTDWKHVTMGDAKSVNPIVLNYIVDAIKGSLPISIPQAYDVNFPTYLVFFINILKSLLPKKFVTGRLQLADSSILLESIPKDVLPVEYGGNAPSVFKIYEETTIKRFHKYRDQLIRQKALVHAEKPFVPQHLHESNYDTFRKLEID